MLAILAKVFELGEVGWVAGLAFGLVLCAALLLGMRRTGMDAFGPANWVTLSRATLVGCVTALIADSFEREIPVGVLVALVAVNVVLDALDGRVARSTGTASGFGARFDLELDVFLNLALSVYVARSVGVWVLAIETIRYAYVAAGWLLPWMRLPAPRRSWKRIVQGSLVVVFTVAAADVLPTPMTIGSLVLALVLYSEVVCRDIVWLWRRHLTASVG